jgi:hypothetical protein
MSLKRKFSFVVLAVTLAVLLTLEGRIEWHRINPQGEPMNEELMLRLIIGTVEGTIEFFISPAGMVVFGALLFGFWATKDRPPPSPETRSEHSK